MAESRAVERVREELEKCSDFSEKVNILSIKVKWGQEDMKDIGNLRQFLAKYPDVFTCDAITVKLTNPPVAPLTTAKGKAPGPPPKASFSSKAGIAVPKPSLAPTVPKKRGFGDLAGGDDVDAKARRYPDYNEHESMHPSSPPGLNLDSGRPSSKASIMYGAGDKGGCKGCKDNGKSDKGLHSQSSFASKGASKFKGNPFEEAEDEDDGGMDVDDGYKGNKNGKSGKETKGMDVDERYKGSKDGKSGKGIDAEEGYKGSKGSKDGKGGKEAKGMDADEGYKGSKGSKDGKGGKEAKGMDVDDGYKGGKDGKGGKDTRGMDVDEGCKGSKNGKFGKETKGGGKGDEYVTPHAPKAPPPQSGAPTSKAAPGAKWGGSKPPQAAVFTAEDRKRALLSDSLHPQEAHRGIESFKTNGTEVELSKLSSTLLPTEEARQNSQRCMELLLSTIQQQFGQHSGAPSVDLYGSYAQGTELQGSAMDAAFRLEPDISPEEKEQYIRGLSERLSSQSDFQVFETLTHYPHAESPVAVELKGSTPRLVVNIVVTQQSADRSTSLDSVIKQLVDSHKVARDLVQLVKLWSVNHGLDKHRDGYMNGVAWTVLVLFFLQQQKLVPPYSLLSQDQTFTPAACQMSLATLLCTFFGFLAKRGASDAESPLRGISVHSGDEFAAPSLMVEDPAHLEDTRQQQSLSESLGEIQWTKCVEEAKKAANRIGVRPQRWFHWAEVFDPTERKNVAHPGLAQYLKGIETLPANEAAKGGDKGKGPPGKGKDSFGKGDAPSCGKDACGKGKDSIDGKGKDSMDGKGKDDSKGKDDFFGKGKDGSFSKGKDDTFGKGKDDSSGKGGSESFGKSKDESYGKGKEDSYGKGKENYYSDSSTQDSYGKGKDGCSGKASDYSYGKGKSDSYGKGKDSYSKGDDYSYKGKGGKSY